MLSPVGNCCANDLRISLERLGKRYLRNSLSCSLYGIHRRTKVRAGETLLNSLIMFGLAIAGCACVVYEFLTGATAMARREIIELVVC